MISPRKLLAGALLSAALILPAAPAVASEPGLPAGTQECPQAGPGRVVWHWDPRTGTNRYYKLCIYTGP